MVKKLTFFLFALLSIGIGLYPITYCIIDPSFGLLASKSPELLANSLWYFSFYTHILMGGLSLLVGWSQFSDSLRKKRLSLHRNLGKIYLFAVATSGIASLVIAYHATGGIVAKLGFATLGVLWLFTTTKAYLAVRQGQIKSHQYWMILSFALTWGAVTLRLWMPILVMNIGFERGYPIVAWLAWVPNLLVGLWLGGSLQELREM